MSIFENELILPGAITEIMSDYSYGYDSSQFGATDSVAIIGTAFNGPVGKPVEIYSPEHARYIFGDTYDSRTRREATLVSEILNAWDRGCRTIYAIRVSGKAIHKDFQLAIDTNLKLRVSGIFPSNQNKDVFMVYDDSVNAEKIKIYKPANRATIQEKVQGLVDQDDSVLTTTLEINNSYGLTKESSLVELIKIINEHPYNNVLRLSIVDEEGNDVTISSKEAQSLSAGVMFAGAYFIGRNKNKTLATTNLAYMFATPSNKPYASFDEALFKKLTINTDINKDIPIYGENVQALNEKFIAAGVSMTKMFDILSVPGLADEIYGKDELDYEEVEIPEFELYKRLGSGYAITAKAEFKGSNNDIKIKETSPTDENRIKPIQDGIYSMLENLKSNYRTIANGYADSAIAGKLPKKTDFKIARANEYVIFSDKVVAIPKVKKDDILEPKTYQFVLDKVDGDYGDGEAIKPELYTTKTIEMVSKVDAIETLKGKKFENGSLFITLDATSGSDIGTLHRYTNGDVITLDSATTSSDLAGKLIMIEERVFQGVLNGTLVEFIEVPLDYFGDKTYVLVESAQAVSVYSLSDDSVNITLEPVGGIDKVFSDDEDKTLITIQSEAVGVNKIVIKSAALDFTTLEEFVELLNTDKDLKRFFTFAMNKGAELQKDEYIIDDVLTGTGLVNVPVTSVEKEDRTVTYDTTIYIPYKTTDNFARHLAQHCTYTSLKTAPTHGIIGCTKLMDVNLNSVASKVNSLLEIDFNLYAKKPNGRDMLDRNNLPYPIGRNISVVVGQYVVNSGSGYSYISNGSSGYAGMISVLPLDQSSTAQPINIPTPMYELTNYQLEKLTQKGFITFKQSYTRGFVVTDGITMAPATSPFRRLNVTRIIGSIEELIRAAVEPFIGKQNHLTNRNSMQTAIKSSLEKLKGTLIEGYDFQLIVDPATIKLGIIEIDYRIVPVYEIREVRNRISIKESL